MRRTVHRRRFIQGVAAGGAVLAFGRRASAMRNRVEPVVLSGTGFDLVIDETPINITVRSRPISA